MVIHWLHIAGSPHGNRDLGRRTFDILTITAPTITRNQAPGCRFPGEPSSTCDFCSLNGRYPTKTLSPLIPIIAQPATSSESQPKTHMWETHYRPFSASGLSQMFLMQIISMTNPSKGLRLFACMIVADLTARMKRVWQTAREPVIHQADNASSKA